MSAKLIQPAKTNLDRYLHEKGFKFISPGAYMRDAQSTPVEMVEINRLIDEQEKVKK